MVSFIRVLLFFNSNTIHYNTSGWRWWCQNKCHARIVAEEPQKKGGHKGTLPAAVSFFVRVE